MAGGRKPKRKATKQTKRKRISPLALAISFFCLAFVIYPAWQARGEVLVMPSTVRVGLAQNTQTVDIGVSGNYRLIDRSTNQLAAELITGERWQISYAGQDLQVLKDGEPQGIFGGPLVLSEIKHRVSIQGAGGALLNSDLGQGTTMLSAGNKTGNLNPDLSQVAVENSQGQTVLKQSGGQNLISIYNGPSVRRYRGDMEFRRGQEGLSIINEVGIEYYLYGVVPSEMPSNWPEEALKAQAVAARSYVLAQLGSYASQGFDVMATQSSQVYGGYDAENARVREVVDQTRGQVMTYRGRPINAFFHSSSGGYTENSEDVWTNSLGYMRGKNDPTDQNEQHYNWQVTMTPEQIRNLMAAKGYQFSEVTDINELERTASGARVKRMVVSGLDLTGESLMVDLYNADKVRTTLGLKSALFNIQKESDEEGVLLRVTFNGSGWGHGLGMSQYGAMGMANQGYNYQDILTYYYSDVTISANYGR